MGKNDGIIIDEGGGSGIGIVPEDVLPENEFVNNSDNDRMITYNHANGNYDAFKKKFIPNTLQCMTKAKVIEYINVDELLINSYLSNQLVPRGKVVGKDGSLFECGFMAQIQLTTLVLNVAKTYRFNFGTTGRVYGFINFVGSGYGTPPSTQTTGLALSITSNSFVGNFDVVSKNYGDTYAGGSGTTTINCFEPKSNKIFHNDVNTNFIDITLTRKSTILTGAVYIKFYCVNVKPPGWNYFFRSSYSLYDYNSGIGVNNICDFTSQLSINHTTSNAVKTYHPVSTAEVYNGVGTFVTNKVILGDTAFTPSAKISTGNFTQYRNPSLKVFDLQFGNNNTIQIDKFICNFNLTDYDYHCIAEFANGVENSIINRAPAPSEYGITNGMVENKDSVSIWIRRNPYSTIISVYFVVTVLYFGPTYSVNAFEAYRVNNGTTINNFLTIDNNSVDFGSQREGYWPYTITIQMKSLEFYPLPQGMSTGAGYFEGVRTPYAQL